MDLLYPKTCCFCGKVSTTPLCDECAGKIEYISEPRCKRCGKPVRYAQQEFCHDCEKNSFSYEQGKNIWLHKGVVRWSIYQFKYHNRRLYGKFYAEEMYRLYGDTIKAWGSELIIPVPLHRKRRRKRGYNQAEIIARHLGRLSGIPVDVKCVRRVANTRPQKELNDKERKKNLREAFRVAKVLGDIKNVLLIDDIYTTGNTLDSVARVLKEKGVKKVCFLTISIGQGF